MSSLSKHFHRRELDRHLEADAEQLGRLRQLCEQLEVLRAELGAPIVVTPHGGFHGPTFDRAWRKRSPGSEHYQATAADIVVRGYTPAEVGSVIWRLIDEGRMVEGGIGVYDSFTHYDIRTIHGEQRARWPRFGAWRLEDETPAPSEDQGGDDAHADD